jgi:hypothetical protein
LPEKLGEFMNPRFTLFAFLCAIAVSPALVSPVLAGPRDDMLAGAARCAGIADDRTFLDCYYGAAQPLRAKLGLPPAPSSQQILVPPAGPNGPAPVAALPRTPVANAAPARPGFWERTFTHVVEKPEAPTRMASYRFDGAGLFTVTLANGEVWRQTAGDSILARWRNRPETYVVTILPGQNIGTKGMKVGNDQVYQVEQAH